jgi:hypothetical protein
VGRKVTANSGICAIETQCIDIQLVYIKFINLKELTEKEINDFIRKSIFFFIKQEKITARKFAELIEVDESSFANYKKSERNISLVKLLVGINKLGYGFAIRLKTKEIVFTSKLGDISYKYAK